MLFFEYSFIFIFLPIVLGLYYLLPQKFRNFWLLLSSCFFYSVSNFEFLPILLFSSFIDYYFGKVIHDSKTEKIKKLALAGSLILNLGLLAYFKYAGFFLELINTIPVFENIPQIDVILPIGISFYTFQSMSYSIDLYRGMAKRSFSLINFSSYVVLFPQLIAGPIVRYKDIADQLDHRNYSVSNFSKGLEFFSIGMAKKILLADTAALFCDPIFLESNPGFLAAWLSTGLFSMQIYFDFSAYSDMAIGLGKMIGFEFPQNFNSPYKACSFSDFWRRWHITLSTWLRDNLYLSLGGNRKGPMRTYSNLLIVMLLGGLWHGASINFVIWGAMHGLFLAIERYLCPPKKDNSQKNIWRQLTTLFGVTVAWVFFRCEDLSQSLQWLKAMSSPFEKMGDVPMQAYLLLGALVITVLGFNNSNELLARQLSTKNSLLLLTLFVVSLFVGMASTRNTFIYFRF